MSLHTASPQDAPDNPAEKDALASLPTTFPHQDAPDNPVKKDALVSLPTASPQNAPDNPAKKDALVPLHTACPQDAPDNPAKGDDRGSPVDEDDASPNKNTPNHSLLAMEKDALLSFYNTSPHQGDAPDNHVGGDNREPPEDGNDASEPQKSDYVCHPTPAVVIRNPIRRLQLMLEHITDASDRRNVVAAIELLRSGVAIRAGQVISDGKLINGQDWRPEMGRFFTPGVVNVLSSVIGSQELTFMKHRQREFTLYPELPHTFMMHKVHLYTLQSVWARPNTF